MKLRSYFRQPVKQAALLTTQEIADIPCEIMDFCPAGLCLRMNGQNPLAQSGIKGEEAEVVFTPAGKVITFRIKGTLSHFGQNSVGFVFSQSPPFSALLSLQENALLSSPPSEKKDQEEFSNIHKQCVRAFENALGPTLDNLSSQITSQLYPPADGEAENGSRPALSRTENQAALDTNEIIESFYIHALEQVRSFIVPDLSLQPETGALYTGSPERRQVFEDWMNLVDKVIRLESKNEEILAILSSRFSALFDRDITNHNNPFGPHVLFHAFQFSLEGTGLNNAERDTIYGVFAGFLEDCLDGLYGDLQHLTKPLESLLKALSKPSTSPPSLLESSVDALQLEALPDYEEDRDSNAPFPFHTPPESDDACLPLTQAPSSETPKNNTETRPLSAFGLDLEPDESLPPAALEIEPAPESRLKPLPSPRQQPDAFTAFVLLSRYAESQEAKSAQDAATKFDAGPLIEALQKLQTQIRHEKLPYLTAPKLQSGLTRILAESGQEHLIERMEARETFQIIGLLLDAIIGDSSIPTGLMPFFGKLQIPLLIAGLVDPSLLNANIHPAREVLNQIEKMSLATSAEGEIDNARLLQSLNRIIDQLCAAKPGDPGAFQETMDALQKLAAPLVKAYKTRLERVAESSEGGHRLEQARRLVDREIDARMGGQTVHAIIPALLDAGWRQLLVLTVLRQGQENDEWRRQLSIIDLLINRLSHASPMELPAQFSVKALKNYLLDQLSSIGAESAATNRIVNEIGELMANGPSEVGTLAYVNVPAADREREKRESNLQTRLQGFRAGEWLKFAVARNTWTPLRLTWIGKNPSRFVFVNRKGVKTLDLDAIQFIKLLDEKRASRIESLEEFPLVERISKALLHTLRERLR